MAQFVTTNAAEVRKSSKATREQAIKAMLFANGKTAQAGQEFVRRYIPPPKGDGAFPGYAATGALRNAVSVKAPIRTASGCKSEIYMADDKTRVYRRIHEYGGIIRARRTFLRFPKPPPGAPRSRPIPGNVAFERNGFIYAKAVRIKPKHYWRDGWQYGQSRFNTVFDKYIKIGLATTR